MQLLSVGALAAGSWGKFQNREDLDILKRAFGRRYFDELAQAPFYALARHVYNWISYSRHDTRF